jgi:outer membrane protein TolC
MQLLQLIGLPVAMAVELTTGLDETPAGGVADADSLSVVVTDTAVGSRAAVLQAEEAVTIQEVLTSVTRWDRLPTVTLKSTFARIGYPETGVPWKADLVSDWTIGVSVSVPLWTSGRLSGNTIVSEAALAQARIRAEQTRDGAALDARAAVLRLRTAQASWAATQRTVEQAERAYQIATLRYQEGISTQTELVDARLQLEQAQANRATAARDAHVARTRLRLLQQLPLAGADVAQTLSNAASGQQAIQQPAATGTSGSTP